MKRILQYSIVLSIFFLAPFSLFSQNSGKIKTIIIDAGHGGKDPGALGKKSKEKNIALAVALKTGHYEQNLKGVKVIYTRKTDKFVELHRRGKIANEAKGDLFISIHCNSNNSHKPYGAETYALGVEEKRTKRNMEVAMTENASIMLEENQEDIYSGFNPNSEESLISLTLFQSEYLLQSIDLASRIQKQFKTRVGRKDRGVHQAGFLVLWRTAMPSVLVELGYISNPTEEAFLLSEKGQTYMASAIYRAVKEYKRDYESESGAYDYRKEGLDNEEETAKNKNEQEISKQGKDNTSITFRVQFYVTPKQLKKDDKRFKSLKDIYMYEHNGMYKFTSGKFNSQDEAEDYKKTVRSKGFTDAFTVAFLGDERISLSKAKQILNEK